MSTESAKASAARSATDNSNELEESVSEDDESVEDFLTGIQFFPVPKQLAARILSLNQKLGDKVIEAEFDALPSDDTPVEEQTSEIANTWIDLVISRVSSLLFREESPSDAAGLSEEELACAFPKTISEKIYDRLGLLSLSPHAGQGGTFSLREELTEGIAEDIGLGSYRRPEISEELSQQVKTALFDLAQEFQKWLLEEWSGRYRTEWGEVRASYSAERKQVFSDRVVVWLKPDVETEVEENLRSGER